MPIPFYTIKKYCQYSIYYDAFLKDISFAHQRHKSKARILLLVKNFF